MKTPRKVSAHTVKVGQNFGVRGKVRTETGVTLYETRLYPVGCNIQALADAKSWQERNGQHG